MAFMFLDFCSFSFYFPLTVLLAIVLLLSYYCYLIITIAIVMQQHRFSVNKLDHWGKCKASKTTHHVYFYAVSLCMYLFAHSHFI